MFKIHNFFGDYKLIVFVKNKLVTIDTVLPLLLEMNHEFKVKSKIVVWDDLAHNAIKNNVVIMDLINIVGCELYITKGEKRKWLRRYYIMRSLLYIVAESFFGAKIIHFGHLNAGFLKIVGLICYKNVYYMSSGSYNFFYKQYSLISKKKTHNRPPIGKNIISITEDIEKTKFKDYIHNKNIYIFNEPRKRESWIKYVYSQSDYYFDKYHNSVDTSKGVLIYILGVIDAEEHSKNLFHSTMDILFKIQHNIPVLLKPHAVTEIDTVINKIAGHDQFHITYLHPSFLATKAKVFLANNFSNTFGDAHTFGVKTIEYTNHSARYSKKDLEYFSGGSVDSEYVDFFIDNDSSKFSTALNSCLLDSIHRPKANGNKFTNNKLKKALL
jgi:hypothetical protein